ncbi:MAG: nicotinamide mononucleotide transporter [Bacteroidetes bacterium]|nr:nicotinamide mononucleotide transporter [Bacteroidota bacterium]MBK8659022.1 nicotinamide mononucleotide transporter [Bacteroidota bacterium]
MNAIEYAAFLLGVAYVILAARGHVGCWLFGILSSAIYIYLNYQWQLYYDAALQLFYVGLGIYGWMQWNATRDEPIRIVTMPIAKQFLMVVFAIPISLLLGYGTYTFLKTTFTFLDAGITVFSLLATYLTAKKMLQSWVWWIVIDLIATGLYIGKEAYITALLYVVYTVAAVYGYTVWKKQMQTSE